jgi:hypothetical protein
MNIEQRLAEAIQSFSLDALLNTGGIIENDCGQTTIRLARRTYSPILRRASLPDTITVPWWEGRTLRYQYD